MSQCLGYVHDYQSCLSRGCVLPCAGDGAGDLMTALPSNLARLLTEDGEILRRVDAAHTATSRCAVSVQRPQAVAFLRHAGHGVLILHLPSPATLFISTLRELSC